MGDANTTYVFRVHYYDPQAEITREFLLFYYLENDTVELYDAKSRRLFLKRFKAPPSLERQLYINNTIQLVSRQLKVVDYGDERTRRLLDSKRVSRVGLTVKPHASKHVGEILQRLLDADLDVSYVHMSRASRCSGMTSQLPAEPSAGHSLTQREQVSRRACPLDPLIEIEVVGREADERVEAVVGPADPAVAREGAPRSLRALYGVSREENVVAIVGSNDAASSVECARPEGAAENGYPSPSTSCRGAPAPDCSCCIVKPSGLKHAGDIIRDILEAGFNILAMQSFHLTKNAASEFLEVYQTVLKEHPLMVEELTSGMCVAMHVEHPEKNTVKRLRELTGPFDSEMARTLRPKSLRAKYGADRVRNAVHCTDLPEDGELEVHYFFHVLPDALKERRTITCANA